MLEELSGWGRYPRRQGQALRPTAPSQCQASLLGTESLIPRGRGRSYGDASLADVVLETRYLDHFQSFDLQRGILGCAAGVSLDEILRVCVPKGWFLPVVPGTRQISLGGAIASDVHGKNHHHAGSFSDHVLALELMLGNGEILTLSPSQHPDLFDATCGGMGLTGLILSATLQLMPIPSSDMRETTWRAPTLDAVLDAFQTHQNAPYSVAWVDCLAKGRELGRSLLMLGEHAPQGPLICQPPVQRNLPLDLPPWLLNPLSTTLFNEMVYLLPGPSPRQRRVPFEHFFFPLDHIGHWNRLYGKPGFVQYQVVLPLAQGRDALRALLERIAASGLASFLAVLKVFGKGNGRHLSFPMEGYTLALDFKAEARVFKLLDELDELVMASGGRLYLTKDARMSAACFRAGYPRWQEFEALRHRYHATGKFASVQSRRLGLA